VCRRGSVDAATVRPGWSRSRYPTSKFDPATATFDHHQSAFMDRPPATPFARLLQSRGGQTRLAKCAWSSATDPLLSNADHHRDAELVCKMVEATNVGVVSAHGMIVNAHGGIGGSDLTIEVLDSLPASMNASYTTRSRKSRTSLPK
jgi:hypothetical protein